jgi:hypothetical protein
MRCEWKDRKAGNLGCAEKINAMQKSALFAMKQGAGRQ